MAAHRPSMPSQALTAPLGSKLARRPPCTSRIRPQTPMSATTTSIPITWTVCWTTTQTPQPTQSAPNDRLTQREVTSMSTLIEEQTSTTTDTNLEEVFRSIAENEESHLLDDTDSGDHERFSHYVSKEDIVRPSTSPDPTLEEVVRASVENEGSHLLDDTDSGDHERFSHYVSKEYIVRSSMSGAPVIALCGKKWTPKRNPGKYLVCPDCNERLEKFPQT